MGRERGYKGIGIRGAGEKGKGTKGNGKGNQGKETSQGDLKPSKPFSLETFSGKHPLFRPPPLWWPALPNLIIVVTMALKLQGWP